LLAENIPEHRSDASGMVYVSMT